MSSLLFYNLKQFDLYLSQLKDAIKLTEVIGKSIIDNEYQNIISFEITLEFKYLKISF